MELTALDIRSWLDEDIGSGDRTTDAVVPPGARCQAAVHLKERGVVCGLAVAESVFRELDAEVTFEPTCDEGDRAEPRELARVEGDAHAILAGERVALNLLSRLCGIATLTRAYVDAVEGTGVTILDTRKTTPGLRALEKHAVRCGGGINHRFGLYDAVLIKDNHLRLVRDLGAAVESAHATGLPVEVECDDLGQVAAALASGADRILLDNMSTSLLARAVELAEGTVPLEASGGVTLQTVRAIAETGVDFISIGALTHSARSLDVSLEVLS